MRLLLVEDNPRLAGLIRDGLQGQGFAVDWCGTIAGAETALQVNDYDLLLLDLGLPDGDGLELLRTIRSGKATTPILILTARGGLDDRVSGLDAGADDYLVKPFQIPELAARCRALLRRPGSALGTILVCGSVALDTAERAVYVATVPVEAPPREVDLLEHLLRRNGHVVAKPALENSLYAMDSKVTPNALEAVLSRLRKRLAVNRRFDVTAGNDSFDKIAAPDRIDRDAGADEEAIPLPDREAADDDNDDRQPAVRPQPVQRRVCAAGRQHRLCRWRPLHW